ncbi:MAG: TonB-dependent receptor [Burkholderiaceae bacterium]
MSNAKSSEPQRARSWFQHQRIPFRLSPIAAVVASMSMLASGSLYAADPTVAELQAEIARLKQVIAGQAASGKTPTPAEATATTTAAPATESTDKDKLAQTEEPQSLDAIVVRSRNRIELLKDVPLSVSVVSGKELERLNAVDIKAITQRAANVSWNQGNQRTSSLSIRGIGKIGQTEAQDPGVGLIIDGVNYAYNALSSSYNFFDIDTVEVTRGPQGTLLGKNTTLGVVNVTSKKPSFTPSFDYSLGFGQRDSLIASFASGGAIQDGLLAYRASFTSQKQQGDIVNAYNNDITYQNIDRLSGRLQFLLTPNPDFTARISLDATPRAGETTNGRTIYTPTPALYSNGTATNLSTDASNRLSRSWFTQQTAYSYAGSYLYGGGLNQVDNDNQRPLVTGSKGASAELNWNLGSHTLTSITAFKNYHFDASNDEGTPFDINRNSGGFWNDYKQVSQELRLSSKVGGFVDYQAGLFAMKVNNDADYRKIWGNDAGAWFASNAQYTTLNSDSNGRILMQNSLAGLSMSYNNPTGTQNIVNENVALFGQANWHLSDRLTVTTGLRFTNEHRTNTGSSSIKDNGNGAELNPALVNGVNLGGFNSNAAGALAGANTAAQLSLADFVANKYFGVAIAGAPGTTYNGLTAAQKAQVGAAKTLRASQIGVVFNPTQADNINQTLPALVFSPSYKIDDNTNAYVSYQHGEKAGISQLTNGISNPVKAEKTDSFELGLKTSLLDKTLTLNTDVFLTNIKDYQQSVRVVDQYTTALNNGSGIPGFFYTGAVGNVPKVQVTGLEVDALYTGIRNTAIRFAGAYNNAIYKDFKNSAQPVENGYTGAAPYQDVSGQTLAGAAKFTFNIGADYRIPVFSDKEFHTSFNTAFSSKFNSDVSLSQYAWVGHSSITDFAIGLGGRKQTWDTSLIVKNLFNDATPLSKTWNSYTPATPRWIGILFTGKL